MKNKWKRKKRPRPVKTSIRGNSRQMWKVYINNELMEEGPEYGARHDVSAPCAGRHGTARAA
ncbi:MAG: hypothetical protein OSJ58_07145 [Dysosmobacter sp.]|nr:hypothetical protein [Dysosmobacter sp.]